MKVENNVLKKIERMIKRENIELKGMGVDLERKRHIFDYADDYDIGEHKYHELYEEVEEIEKEIEERLLKLEGMEISRELFYK